MDVETMLAGFGASLSLWVGVLLVAAAFAYAKRFMKGG